MEPFARCIRGRRQHLPALVDDGELVDEPLEFADQMRRDKNGAAGGRGILVCPDDRFDELAANDGIEARGRLVEDQ